MDIFPEFSNTYWLSLTRPYTRCEIEAVAKNLGALKAHGPDDFQALFFQKHWDLVAKNVYKLVMDFLDGKGMPSSLNNTFLILIPKIESPKLASQFRPIGLCNVINKIIMKCIVN